MGTEVGLVTLLCERWEKARANGTDLSPEELCRDHPEALEEVRAALRNLRAAERVVGDTARSAGRTPGGTDPHPPDPVLPPDCRYRLVRFLAEGGLGRVYVGYDTELNREVAIKFILPNRLSAEDAARRFGWEAEVTGRLEHPGVAPVYGLIRDPAAGQVAYAMRLLPGETLQQAGDRCHAAGRPAADAPAFRELLAHFARACRTVGFAHARGFLHRDLKPSNVMVSPAGETWVLDWGLAKALATDGTTAPHPPYGATRAGQVLGTPAYMAPEQAVGEVDRLGPAADVYALGGILYFLLTGRPPHHAPTAAGVLTRAVNADVAPARKLNPAAPPELEAVCRRALSAQPEDRHPSAEAVAEEVERFLARPASRRTRRRVWAAAGLAAVLAAAAGVVVVKVRTPDGKETKVEVPDGSQVKVDPKGGVTVELPKDAPDPKKGADAPPKEPTAVADPDRRAAEALRPFCKYMQVQLSNGRTLSLTPAQPLPPEPFVLTRLNLREGEPLPPEFVARTLLPALTGLSRLQALEDASLVLPLTEADLARLADSPSRDSLLTLFCGVQLTPKLIDTLRRFPRLEWLGLRVSEADDRDLGRLRDLPALDTLWLYDADRAGRVTEHGWAALAGLKVTRLGLRLEQGLDRAVYRQVARLPRLRTISFYRHCPDPACLVELGLAPGLTELYLLDANIPADRFRAIGGITRLAVLDVSRSRFREADLKYLTDLPELNALNLTETGVTDAGLATLKPFAGLRLLNLRATRATPAGVKALAAALPDCTMVADAGPIRSRQVAALAGPKPAPRDAFPGEVLAYETFDDPSTADTPVSIPGGVRYAVENGVYAADHPGPGVRMFEILRFGQPAADTAFVARVRGANCDPFVNFRGRESATRVTWLTLTVTTSGQWRVLWYAQEKGPDGNFRPAGVGVLAEGLTGDPELLSGRWVTLAGRSSGDRFEVWVNGRSVARGRVAAAVGEGSDPGGWGATIAATPVAPGAARLEVDYVAVWHLPPDPSR